MTSKARFTPVHVPHDPAVPGVIDTWTLECDHGMVSSEDIFDAFTPQERLNRLVSDRLNLPRDVSNTVATLVAIRSLMGLLLTTRCGCDCGVLPLPLPGLGREDDRGPVQ